MQPASAPSRLPWVAAFRAAIRAFATRSSTGDELLDTYYCSDAALYLVVDVLRDDVVLEDCRTGALSCWTREQLDTLYPL